MTIVSNNNEKRVLVFFRSASHSVYLPGQKTDGQEPSIKPVRTMGLKLEETVVIGDQLLTDVLGGNRGGFNTILVVPVAQTDEFRTKINRYFERKIMAFFKQKGMIQWEDHN